MRFAAAPTALARRDDDALLILDRATGDYLEVTGAGARMWELVVAGCERGAAVDALLDELDVDRATAEADLDAFVADLRARGLLVEAG